MLLGSDLAALMMDIFMVTFTMLDFCRGITTHMRAVEVLPGEYCLTGVTHDESGAVMSCADSKGQHKARNRRM